MKEPCWPDAPPSRFDGSALLAAQIHEDLTASPEPITAERLAEVHGAPLSHVERALERLAAAGQARCHTAANAWSTP